MRLRSIVLPLVVALIGAGLGVWTLATPTHAVIALQPLTITKIASDGNHFLPDDNAYYEISIHNPNNATVYLDTLTDTLPPGFSYNGPSTGLTTSNPAVAGQTLTWTFVSEQSVAAGQTATEDFTVYISADEPLGMYCNTASVDWGTGTASTGPTAPIQVLNDGDTQLTPTCSTPGYVYTATPTVTATEPATATSTPAPPTATVVPPTIVPPAPTKPAGGTAGVISGPNTGSGPQAGAPSILLLALAATMILGGTGAAAYGARRR